MFMFIHSCGFNSVQFFVPAWTVACQAPLSMQFSRQEYWSGPLFPPPADLPNSEMEPAPPMFPALAGGFLTRWAIADAPYSLSPKIFLHISTSHRDSLNFMPLYLPCNLYPIFHKLLLVFKSFPELSLFREFSESASSSSKSQRTV